MKHLIYPICRIPFRIHGVLAIVFIAAGVNISTAELMANHLQSERIFLGLAVCVLGISFFVFETTAQKCQQNANDYQKREKKGITKNLILAEVVELSMLEKLWNILALTYVVLIFLTIIFFATKLDEKLAPSNSNTNTESANHSTFDVLNSRHRMQVSNSSRNQRGTMHRRFALKLHSVSSSERIRAHFFLSPGDVTEVG